MSFRKAFLFLLFIVILPGLPAFTQEHPGLENPLELSPVDPIDVTGDIISAGSSTVFPLSEKIADIFHQEGYLGTMTIDNIGSGAGFSRFCEEGSSDIVTASRPIKESEAEACANLIPPRYPIEFRVGSDALVLTVSTANTFLTDVSLDELALIFGSAELWSDIRPDYPAQRILRFIPGTDSGTFDFFVETVFNKDESILLTAPNTQLSENDNVLVQGIAASPYAIGFFGFAYYLENETLVRPVSIAGVQASAATAEDNTYPLSRPLYLYSDAGVMSRKPQVAAFISYYLTHVNTYILEAGYFPATPAALNLSKQKFLAATLPNQ